MRKSKRIYETYIKEREKGYIERDLISIEIF